MNERQFEKTLKSLANRRRLLILKFLKRNRLATVGNIADNIKLSFKATSKHLSILSSADVVEKEQVGPNVFYAICKDCPNIAKTIIQAM